MDTSVSVSVSGSMFICLGSTLAALFGLLVLGWAAKRERWRPLWVSIAGILLIAAGFGAAETVYEMAAELEEEQRLEQTPVSVAPITPSLPTVAPLPSATLERQVLPSATVAATAAPRVTASARTATIPRPSPTVTPLPSATLERQVVPVATGTSLSTATPRATPTAWMTATPRSSPTPTDPSLAILANVDALAPSLIPTEREILASLNASLDTPPHYILNVVVDFDDLTVAGTAEILYTNNAQESLDAIYLRLYPNARHYEEGETRVEAVNVDGDAVDFTFEDAEDTVLKVPLPTSLFSGEHARLEIAFSVTVPRRSDRFGYDEGVMSLGHWYPMLAVFDDEGWNLDPYVALGDAFYSDVGFYTVHLTVPDGIVVAASGVEMGRIEHRPRRNTIILAGGAVRDFALALSPEYQMVDAQVGDTTVTSYYLPGHEEGGRRALRVAADALEVYNTRFGLYPYSELDVAETSFTVLGTPGGMEFPGIVFISSEFYRPGSLFGSEMDVVVAHEVAHQWWYGVVGNNQVDEPWLDESFATYSSILYAEDEQDPLAGEWALLSQAVLPYQLVQMLGIDGPIESSLLDYGGDLISYQSIVYSKGALFLARLRELWGDDDFFTLLQHHYATHKYDLLDSDAFRRSIEEVAGNAAVESAELTAALALYDDVVVRGQAVEGVPGSGVLERFLEGDLSSEDLTGLMELLEQLLEGLQP